MVLLEREKINFVVPGGTLFQNDNHHEFPDIYQVDEHPLVTDRSVIETIVIMIVDNSKEA